VTEDQRAELYSELFDKLPRTDCGIAKVAPYEWVGGELAAGPQHAATTGEWFGIYRRDGSPTPAATAYTRIVREQEARDAGAALIRLCGG
jgi:hypothetical protein